MKHGFTLIELLAVIVILAIIALIATPTVLNIINNSKKEATRISAENYLDAVEMTILSYSLKANGNNFNGTYSITNNGKTISRDENTILNVSFNGIGIREGSLEIENGVVKKIVAGKIDKWYAVLRSEKVILLDKLPESSLLTGMEFSSKIKSLVGGSSIAYDKEDSIVTKIQFLGSGKLPVGYSLDSLLELPQVDVSANGDGIILAIYDNNGTIYIYCENMISFNEDSSCMFYYFTKLTNISFGDSFTTSTVTDMSKMFHACWYLSSLDLSGFDTSNVTDMSWMFATCNRLESLNISNFNTSKVTNMSKMFSVPLLTTLDLSNFDTSNVTNMYGMFEWSKLTTLNLSNFDTSNVTDMSEMFNNCSSLTTLNLSNFDTSNVTNMYGMFNNCSSLTTLNLSNFDTSNVTDMSEMFSRCHMLESLNISNFNTKKVKSMRKMFYMYTDGGISKSNLSILNLSSFNTSNVTDMVSMFSGCNKLTVLNLANFDTLKVTDISYMFQGCMKLTTLDLSNLNTSNVINMNNVFSSGGSELNIFVKGSNEKLWLESRCSDVNASCIVNLVS